MACRSIRAGWRGPVVAGRASDFDLSTMLAGAIARGDGLVLMADAAAAPRRPPDRGRDRLDRVRRHLLAECLPTPHPDMAEAYPDAPAPRLPEILAQAALSPRAKVMPPL